MPQLRVVVQSRTASARLPAKALLPLAGLPAAVLCALRARNRGADVVLATSSDASDDRLAEVAKAHGLRVIRGPQDDVLARFCKVVADMPGDALVARLTADNPFPDGAFVEALAASLQERGLDHVGTNSPLDGLPYGMSGEVFTVSALRAADRGASSPKDREHVTPWILRERATGLFVAKGLSRPMSHLRCTMDDLRDYLALSAVFDKTRDPINVPWKVLCQALQRLPGQPTWRVPFRVRGREAHSELTLGTAQLGLDYGILNRRGRPSEAEAVSMIERAVARGVGSFDTARDYGESEARLGRIIEREFPGRGRLITKLSALSSLPSRAPAQAVRDAVDASILRSCLELRRRPLDAVLLHRWAHRRAFAGGIWKRLQELKSCGLIAKLGASVYGPKDALEALRDPDIELIQIPFNILDRRWQKAGFVERAQHRPGVMIYARSVLLQGLLAAPARQWPKLGLTDPGRWARKLSSLSRRLGRDGPLDLSIAYVRAQPWLTSAILGMESLPQLEENMRLFRKAPLTGAECRLCESELGEAPERLLNPSLWPRRTKETLHGRKR